MRCALIALLITMHQAALHAADPSAAGLDFFEKRIRPLLVERCYECHSAEKKQKGGLVLDTKAGVLNGGDTGPALVPGEPAKSLLITAVKWTDKDMQMPPKKQLGKEQIADLEAWVKMGAPDPRKGAAPVAKKRGMSIEEGRKFWSLIPPKNVPPPVVADRAWPLNDIDRFVLAKLEEQRLTPAGEADAHSLVRRLYFDLIGLPPSQEEVAAFVRAAERDRQSAIESLVDHLLASPHFGERQGRHWLDAARYADSNGRDRNVVNHHAWRYRDYVIESFQGDKPYDQFIREQIAGDLLPASNPKQRDSQRIATGFLAMGAKAFEEYDAEIFRMDVIDEQIEVISRSVLGLSVSCARCHDHKYDPIPTADYYALAGILRSTQPLYGWGTRGIKATAHHHSEWQAIGPDAVALAPAALEYYRKLQADTLTMFTARSSRYVVVRNISAAKIDIKKEGADKAKLTADIARMEAVVKDWDAKITAMEKALDALNDSPPPEPGWAMAAREREKCEDSRIHIRGDTKNLGDVVPRGMLQVIALKDVPAPAAAQSGRLQLAQWLTHRENPLTARVFVNREWQRLFGRALVTTPDDFGVNGAKPSHPELLDHLAYRFMASGWSVKRLIRDLVLTRAYRLSTDTVAANIERDPDNIFLWRMAPRRLDAESLRDAILAVSGQLNLSPLEKPFLSRYHPRRDAELMTFKPFVTVADLTSSHRSVYLPVLRGTLPEIFSLFDFAAPERPVAQRDESVVPAQSLFFMNNAWVIEQSRHAAQRLLADTAQSDAQRVTKLYQLAFARLPAASESARAEKFLAGSDALLPNPKSKIAPDPAQLREARWVSLCQVVFASAEFRVLR
jgi:cytochrome c553